MCVHSVPVILALSLCSEKSFHAASPAKEMPREANELSQPSNRIVDNPLRLQIKRNKSSHATVHVFLSIRIGNITFKSHLLQPSSLQSVWLYSGITNSSLCCTIEMFKSRIRSRDAASVEDGDLELEIVLHDFIEYLRTISSRMLNACTQVERVHSRYYVK